MLKDKTKKILFITARSDMGGGPKHLHDLLCELKKDHANVNIYAASPLDEPFGSKFRELSIKHVPISARSFSFISFIKLLNFAKANGITIIHSHGRGAGLYSRLLGLFNFKVVHTFHGAHNEKSLTGQVKLYIDKFLKNLTDTFICVSNSEKEKALELNITKADQTVVIPNGVNLEAIEQTPAKDLRATYGIAENKKIWGTLTRLSPEKGNHLFLDTIANNPEKYLDFAFLIAGDGPERNKLEQKIESITGVEIKLIGQTSDPIGFLKGLDGFFSFSLGEGLPYAVLEAIACEKPCALSDVSGHREFANIVTLFELKKPVDFSDYMRKSKATKLPTQYLVKTFVSDTKSVY